MFEDRSNYYYHGSIRRYATLFGSLFGSLYIERTAADKSRKEMVKVPLRYGTGNRYAIVSQSDVARNGPKVAQNLPAMSFSFESIDYDPERQTNARNRLSSSVVDGAADVQGNRVPFNIDFVLDIRTKNLDDMLQIVEQILPRFATPISIKSNDVTGINSEQQTKIIYKGFRMMNDNWEDYNDERKIDWSLGFTVQGYLYGPTKSQSVIEEVDMLLSIDDQDIKAWFEVTENGTHFDRENEV